MDIEEIREFCLSLKAVTEDIKWGHNLCFLLNEKIFLMVNVDSVPTRMSVKVEPDNFNSLCEDSNFSQAPYLAKGQWVSVADITLLENAFAKDLVSTSYRLIFQKLSKKAQAEIEGL